MTVALDEPIGWFVVTLNADGQGGDVFPFPDQAAASRFSVTARLVTPEVYLCKVVVGPPVPGTWSPRAVPGCYHQYGWCRGRGIGGSWTNPHEHRDPPPEG